MVDHSEASRLRRWLEHIRDHTTDDADAGAFARDMALRALAEPRAAERPAGQPDEGERRWLEKVAAHEDLVPEVAAGERPAGQDALREGSNEHGRWSEQRKEADHAN